MEKDEILKELSLSYTELNSYLLTKYGAAKYDYFSSPSCLEKDKRVSRAKEGLYCHHIDEDKEIFLSKPECALSAPFEYQKKERLVYCNILEHLILHIKIHIMRNSKPLNSFWEYCMFFLPNGVSSISGEINFLFMTNLRRIMREKRYWFPIRNNYYDYIAIIKMYLTYSKSIFSGDTQQPSFLIPGSIVHFSDADAEIISIDLVNNTFLLKLPDGSQKDYDIKVATHQFTFNDYYLQAIAFFSTDNFKFHPTIFNDLLSTENADESEYLLALLSSL